MGPTFPEKSLWVTFATILAAFGLYFAAALPGASSDIRPQHVALFVLMVVLLGVAQLVETGSQLWLYRRGA